MTASSRPVSFALFALFAVSALVSFAGAQTDTLGHQDTPLIPGTKWHVHDGLRPQPPVIAPAPTDGKPVLAPADAVILFDGKTLGNWRMGDNKPCTWKLDKGSAVANGTGDMYSKDEFGDCQLHVEWATPTETAGHGGQGRGNSGVWLGGRYEVQVLDSFGNQTYPDGQAGAVYGQYPPLANVSRKPGEWQTFDIFYTAPRFDGDKLKEPGYATVIHNGVLVQNHVAILGDTAHAALATYRGTGTRGPVRLQGDHGPVRYRNIWVRPL